MSFIAKRHLIIFFLLYFNIEIKGDNFQYNTYNNHGVVLSICRQQDFMTKWRMV